MILLATEFLNVANGIVLFVHCNQGTAGECSVIFTPELGFSCIKWGL